MDTIIVKRPCRGRTRRNGRSIEHREQEKFCSCVIKENRLKGYKANENQIYLFLQINKVILVIFRSDTFFTLDHVRVRLYDRRKL